ncbi:MAG: MsnO8 family LLM class oxidoreductase [Streptosporangiales bacterium]|nr:MsnO8 family LLM class oxidoreductase [Streptosporangiales bacterium]
MTLRLSVLELLPLSTPDTTRTAVAAGEAIAQAADQLGYERLWIAEHHNMPAVAATAPAVMVAHLAASTQRIRVGSGGVMLPNHAPLVVAEQFALLEALHPDRIDLGIGRAPGTDPVTSTALRSGDRAAVEAFPQHVQQIVGLLDGPLHTPDGSFELRATPLPTSAPPVWLLGSSDYSARLAAELGLPFAFAHHFSARNTDVASALYLDSFKPSEQLAKPELMICTSAVVADTQETAERLALPHLLRMAQMRLGSKLTPALTADQAAAHEWTDAERELVAKLRADAVVGTPATAQQAITALADRTGATEIMVLPTASGLSGRLYTLELLADAFCLTSRSETGEC